MASTDMEVQVKHGSPGREEINTCEKALQSKEQHASADEYALKVRKPYTITKQRERWTEEEHEKFIEALKLHGRAWRKIEEHVGTKTAVQIRSHAQKFFSKVARESNKGDESNSQLIAIPPPRPKRKPMNPYPRKVGTPVKTGISVTEKLARSVSQDVSEQETQSPTSVLPENHSEASARAESCTPDGSSSPVSSALALNAGTSCGSEIPTRVETRQEDGNSSPDEEVSLNLELSTQDGELSQEDQSAVQCLKLFGKTLLVNDSFGTSFSTIDACKAESWDKSEGDHSLFPLKVIPLKFHPSKTMSSSNRSPNRCNEIKSDDLLYPRTAAHKSNTENACSAVSFPWLTLSGGTSTSTQQLHNPTPVRAQLRGKENLHTEEEKEVSSSGSTADLGCASSDGEKSQDIICLHPKGNVKSVSFSSRLSKRTSADSEDCRKGFVPYKRHAQEQNRFLDRSVEELEKPQSCICL